MRRLIPATLVALVAFAAGWILLRPASRPTAPADSQPEVVDGPALGEFEIEGTPGRWRKLAVPSWTEADDEHEELSDRLGTIGYVSGFRAIRPERTITVYDTSTVVPGTNFYTSGHLAGAILMDMWGEVLHRWELPAEEIWPGIGSGREDQNPEFWRRAHLFENGNVLAIFEGLGIVKVDKDSNLLWAVENGAHHDLEVLANGDILVLARTDHLIPRLHPSETILEDFVVRLDADGNELERFSVVDCLENSEYGWMLQHEGRGTGDIFHTNTVARIAGRFADRAPWLRDGNLLLSLRRPNAVAVVDPTERRVAKLWIGPFVWQHDPKILASGTMLLFDNRGARNGHSRVLEIDPVTEDLAWSFAGTTGDTLYSRTCGTAERLPSGNTLITESDNGRALEVTPEGRVVWEFYNPHRAGENGEYIATLFEMIRLPKEFAHGWVSRK